MGDTGPLLEKHSWHRRRPGTPDAHVGESVIPVQGTVIQETHGAEKLKQDFLIFNFVF